MKILAFGDTHGDVSLSKALAEKAKRENVELVLVCGDITHFDTFFPGTFYEFLKRNLKVMFVRGNHESEATAEFLGKTYNIKDLHGKVVTYQNIAFIGLGGANVGPFPFHEDGVLELLRNNLSKISKENLKKIIVSHVHPAGSKIENFSTYFKGSTALEKIIKEFEPDLVLCSHVHEAAGIEEQIGKTRVINVGKFGKILDV
ncbi:MAG: uncharacterized protein PWP03_407 [Candidatus Woesearchaeota archaeon]|nr:uncharacterized protein [Candidatus Woesearchaeota archaeon]MDN5327769.1 uncharacterized protein [Candidatus Woesearchaeota archaeon]